MKKLLHIAILVGTVSSLSACHMWRHENDMRTTAIPNAAFANPHDPAFDEERMRCSPGNHKKFKC